MLLSIDMEEETALKLFLRLTLKKVINTFEILWLNDIPIMIFFLKKEKFLKKFQ